jgi:hypothetical protein
MTGVNAQGDVFSRFARQRLSGALQAEQLLPAPILSSSSLDAASDAWGGKTEDLNSGKRINLSSASAAASSGCVSPWFFILFCYFLQEHSLGALLEVLLHRLLQFLGEISSQLIHDLPGACLILLTLDLQGGLLHVLADLTEEGSGNRDRSVLHPGDLSFTNGKEVIQILVNHPAALRGIH